MSVLFATEANLSAARTVSSTKLDSRNSLALFQTTGTPYRLVTYCCSIDDTGKKKKKRTSIKRLSSTLAPAAFVLFLRGQNISCQICLKQDCPKNQLNDYEVLLVPLYDSNWDFYHDGIFFDLYATGAHCRKLLAWGTICLPTFLCLSVLQRRKFFLELCDQI